MKPLGLILLFGRLFITDSISSLIIDLFRFFMSSFNFSRPYVFRNLFLSSRFFVSLWFFMITPNDPLYFCGIDFCVFFVVVVVSLAKRKKNVFSKNQINTLCNWSFIFFVSISFISILIFVSPFTNFAFLNLRDASLGCLFEMFHLFLCKHCYKILSVLLLLYHTSFGILCFHFHLFQEIFKLPFDFINDPLFSLHVFVKFLKISFVVERQFYSTEITKDTGYNFNF